MTEDSYILYTFLNAAITRIGAVLLIVFGIQILINLYRYNMRISVFYDSRADAMELNNSDGKKNLEDLVKTMSSDNIDFGRSPKTPTTELKELLESVLNTKK